jgi:hypothetical protein
MVARRPGAMGAMGTGASSASMAAAYRQVKFIFLIE